MEGCIGLLDDGDEDKEEQIIDLEYHIEMLKGLKEQFLSFEIEIERRLHMVDIKNVEAADGNASQDGRKLTVDEFLSGESPPSFIEKDEAVHNNGVVNLLQGVENYEESLSEINEKRGEGKTLKVKSSNQHLQPRRRLVKLILVPYLIR